MTADDANAPSVAALRSPSHAEQFGGGWCGRWRALYTLVPEGVRDLVYPALAPETVEQVSTKQASHVVRTKTALDRIAAVSDDEEELTRALANLKTLAEHEEERRSSVEARLTTVLGMTSIAAAIAFGALTAVIGTGFQETVSVSGVLAAALTIYAVLQLTCALLAARSGLARRTYRSLTIEDVLPNAEESRVAAAKRHLRAYVECTNVATKANNAKVTAMAVAHVALRNFVCAACVLTVVLSLAMFTARADPSAVERVVRRLRSDSTLLDLLRGPAGPTGARGPEGPMGPTTPSTSAPRPGSQPSSQRDARPHRSTVPGGDSQAVDP